MAGTRATIARLTNTDTASRIEGDRLLTFVYSSFLRLIRFRLDTNVIYVIATVFRE
jgi:hypothetical protein